MTLKTTEKSFSILIADDEQTSREIVTNILSKRYPDVRIDAAENGVAGLELFMKFHHDLIITDYRMPHMSGLRMVSEIRAISPGTPVIFLTASIAENDLRDILHRETTHYLRKPLHFSELYDLIARHIPSQ